MCTTGRCPKPGSIKVCGTFGLKENGRSGLLHGCEYSDDQGHCYASGDKEVENATAKDQDKLCHRC